MQPPFALFPNVNIHFNAARLALLSAVTTAGLNGLELGLQFAQHQRRGGSTDAVEIGPRKFADSRC